jgi:hypothetical protein
MKRILSISFNKWYKEISIYYASHFSLIEFDIKFDKECGLIISLTIFRIRLSYDLKYPF